MTNGKEALDLLADFNEISRTIWNYLFDAWQNKKNYFTAWQFYMFSIIFYPNFIKLLLHFNWPLVVLWDFFLWFSHQQNNLIDSIKSIKPQAARVSSQITQTKKKKATEQFMFLKKPFDCLIFYCEIPQLSITKTQIFFQPVSHDATCERVNADP